MANPQQYGNFVPTTNVWDFGEIYALQGESEQLKELLVRLYQNLNLMSTSLNLRDAGYYITQEFVNGQLWFPNPNVIGRSNQAGLRQDYRKVIYRAGPIPNNGFTVPHGITITGSTTFTRIYGVANDRTNMFYYPLPFVDTLGGNDIEVIVIQDDVNVFPNPLGVGYSGVTDTYIVLEYLQS